MAEKKIWLTVPRGLYGKGGIERQCQYLLAAWDRNVSGIPVTTLMTRGDGGNFQWPLAFAGAAVKFLGNCLMGRVAAVHLNTASGASLRRKMVLAGIARRFGVPVIIHLHGGKFDHTVAAMSPGLLARTKAYFQNAAACIVLGQYWADLVHEKLGVPRDRITVLMNAVPAPARPSPPDFVQHPLHILFLGELGERKGVHILIPALAQLKDHPGWRATLAGNGDIETYRQLAVQHGIADRIAFPGWQTPESTARLLESAHVLTLPSLAENLPMAVLEGLASGLVVITTPVGAIPEVVQDDVNGRLVPIGNADALAAAFRQILDDPATAGRYSAAAQATFRDRLSIDSYCQRLGQLYRNVTQK